MGSADANRTDELVELICMEIGDREIEAAFRRAVHRHRPATTPAGPRQILVSPALARELSAIMEAFCQAIGPVGAVVMKSKLRQWADMGSPSPQRLGDLVAMLAAEIDDEKARERFSTHCGKGRPRRDRADGPA